MINLILLHAQLSAICDILAFTLNLQLGIAIATLTFFFILSRRPHEELFKYNSRIKESSYKYLIPLRVDIGVMISEFGGWAL